MNIDEEWFALILIMIYFINMVFLIREWLRYRKKKNRWRD